MDVYLRARRRETESGYVRCRKVVVTPTRILPMPAETLMSCRVLRSEGSQKALRIAFRLIILILVECCIWFREEDGSRMYRATTSVFLIERRVIDILKRGITLCGWCFYLFSVIVIQVPYFNGWEARIHSIENMELFLWHVMVETFCKFLRRA